MVRLDATEDDAEASRQRERLRAIQQVRSFSPRHLERAEARFGGGAMWQPSDSTGPALRLAREVA